MIKRHIPNSLTCCNLICGCMATGCAFYGQYQFAILMIILGAVFDFYAGTAQRAPLWLQGHSLEWFYRLMTNPKRMWRRYVIGNPLFLWNMMKEKVMRTR